VKTTVRSVVPCVLCAILVLGFSGFAPAAANPAPGDLNQNGVFDDGDLKILRGYLFGGAAVQVSKYQLDVNQDGLIDIGDVLALGQLIAQASKGKFSPNPTVTPHPATSGTTPKPTLVLLPYPYPKPAPPVKAGDVDGNGVIDMNDVQLLRILLANGQKAPLGLASVDVNGDGQMSFLDLVALVQIVAGKKP
jgi:hypothetical protein